MSHDLISVIIPIYNTAPYLERCLNSVTENTYRHLEIICVNDGSTDDSLAVLNRLSQSDARIKVIDQPNGGVSAARNHGMDMATGKYIAFIDSDDWIHKDYFALLHNAAVETQSDMVTCNYVQVRDYDDSLRLVPLSVPENIKIPLEELHSSGNLISSSWCKLFKHSSIAGLRFPEGISFAEDQIFNVQFFSSYQKPNISRVDFPGYFYFDRPGSLVHNPDTNRFLQIANHHLCHIQDYRFKDIPLSHIYRSLFYYRHEGYITSDKKTVSLHVNRAFRQAHPWLLREKRFSAKEKIKYLIAAISPSLYRAQLLAKDPSIRVHENNLREQARTTSEK